ncbi:MAG: ChaN family lipoprotein [Pseudohongiellaceae bacterium]|nr:ChaN family lipoprotein [Pseudohongiellaceae bacterium]
MKKSRLLLQTALVFGLSACASSSSHWQSPLYADHPLVGRIWSTSTAQFISSERLITELSSSSIVLLGEKHDNADHHRLQREVLSQLHKETGLSVVSFEMMDRSQSELLLDGENLSQLNSDQLLEYLQWDVKGWNWSFYGPLILDVLAMGAELRAANIDSATLGEVYAGGGPAGLENYLGSKQMEQLKAEVDQSHCSLLPASQVPAMARVQQSRDLSMAQSLEGEEAGLKVLVAGNFHVRKDLGVPRYLVHSSERVTSLAFIEVLPPASFTDSSAYLAQYEDGLPYDYVWFTPAQTSEDYCDSLRLR